MTDPEHSYGYSDGQVAMALAVLYAGQRAPQHPRRVAWALHIVAPDNPQHARLRYCCSLCPPCEHEYERDWLDSEIEHASCKHCHGGVNP